ncbi:MAG: nucleoside deaminase [Alphaproteobacteria bacterium]|nr:nucleoside deaminase [Alphaproteobacteria bacterium]MBQ7284772.1 nucleoside deaminase [Alphaproteobacteria bacterium]
MKNIRYMQRALELATQAQSQDEVPIGCIIVNPDNDEIIAETYNLSQHVEDATAHAEITAIRSACQKLGQNRLRGLDMYVTLEPCTMCAAAISFARIENLYFGATDPKGGAVVSGVRFFEQPTCHHRPNVYSGLLEKECAQILKDFFKQKRK